MRVSCPQCKTEFEYYKSEFRPFCSEKCKMIDLGHWFDESYTVGDSPKDDFDQGGDNEFE